MICKPCRNAGDRLTDIALSRGVQRRIAEQLHSECEHPATCACQHRLTSVLETRPKFATGGTIETRVSTDDDIPAILDCGYFISRS